MRPPILPLLHFPKGALDPSMPSHSTYTVAPSLLLSCRRPFSYLFTDGPCPACYSWQPNMPFLHVVRFIYNCRPLELHSVNISRPFILLEFVLLDNDNLPFQEPGENPCPFIVRTEPASSILLIVSEYSAIAAKFVSPLY
jgi:hypothetical protein